MVEADSDLQVEVSTCTLNKPRPVRVAGPRQVRRGQSLAHAAGPRPALRPLRGKRVRTSWWVANIIARRLRLKLFAKTSIDISDSHSKPISRVKRVRSSRVALGHRLIFYHPQRARTRRLALQLYASSAKSSTPSQAPRILQWGYPLALSGVIPASSSQASRLCRTWPQLDEPRRAARPNASSRWLSARSAAVPTTCIEFTAVVKAARSHRPGLSAQDDIGLAVLVPKALLASMQFPDSWQAVSRIWPRWPAGLQNSCWGRRRLCVSHLVPVLPMERARETHLLGCSKFCMRSSPLGA